MTQYACQLDDVRAAASRISGIAHRTPVITCGTIDNAAGCRVYLKCENLQKVGAFKFRGATNTVCLLSDTEAARGVVTHSSGNHAQALALAAKTRGIPAHIVMPSNAPTVKRRAVEGYGARIIECAPFLADRESTADAVQTETGATFVHPYDDPRVIAGQGTVSLELIEQVPDIDTIITPVGGGGLLSGVCIGATQTRPDVRIFAAEPEGADDAARSLASGQLIPQTAPDTIADGLLTSLGELTWPIIRDHVEGIVTVSDAEIVAAMRLLWERAKLVVEPSGAVSLAALLKSASTEFNSAQHVAVVLSGGNVNLDGLPW